MNCNPPWAAPPLRSGFDGGYSQPAGREIKFFLQLLLGHQNFDTPGNSGG